MKGKYVIGIALFVLIIGGTVIVKKCISGPDPSSLITLKGYIGGEKKGFLDNPRVKEILKNKYKIIIDYTKAGSIEMVKKTLGKADFLWPSSQVALALYKEMHKGKSVKASIIFNSPIVMYSWDFIVDAMLKKGLVKEKSGTYTINLAKLVNMIIKGKRWADIGLEDQFGKTKKIFVESTDPSKSNSGNMFSGLLANILNNEDVVTANEMNKIIPKVVAFFKRLGFLQSSTGDIFHQYTRMGIGAKPIIIGYESQIIEFSKKNPEGWNRLKSKIRILYPLPTVWSSHPLIVTSSKAKILLTALKDEELQKIAWNEHGFRTGILTDKDLKNVDVPGIPAQIYRIIQMPTPRVMDVIIEKLGLMIKKKQQ